MNDEIDLNEAIELMMQRGGLSRRAAKRRLLKSLREGKLRSTGFVTMTGPQGEQISDGKRRDIPKEFWQPPAIDAEGDDLEGPDEN